MSPDLRQFLVELAALMEKYGITPEELEQHRKFQTYREGFWDGYVPPGVHNSNEHK